MTITLHLRPSQFYDLAEFLQAYSHQKSLEAKQRGSGSGILAETVLLEFADKLMRSNAYMAWQSKNTQKTYSFKMPLSVALVLNMYFEVSETLRFITLTGLIKGQLYYKILPSQLVEAAKQNLIYNKQTK